MKHLLCAALLALCASAANAQDKITPEAFLDRVTGRTVAFTNFRSGDLVGVEKFLSRTQTLWGPSGSPCTYGTLSIDGHALCFLYETDPKGPHCWVPYQQGDEIFLMFVDGAEIQKANLTDDAALQCEEVPLS